MRLLGALGLVVIALLGGLWFMIRDDASAEAPQTSRRPDRGTPETPAPAAPSAAAPSARSTIVVPRALPKRPIDTGASTSSGGAAPAVEDTAQEPVERPVTFRRTLDEQIGLSEPLLLDCIEKAIKAGAQVDGTTAVSFTIGKQPDGKLGIETTGIEYSSIPDPQTTNCIRDVGKSLTFESLPDGVEKLIAYRKVVVKDGKLTENWLTEFAHNPHLPAPAN